MKGIMKVLVCNVGSSTLKLSLFEAKQERLLAGVFMDWTARPARILVIAPRADLTIVRVRRQLLNERRS
jgi:acetate kinase